MLSATTRKAAESVLDSGDGSALNPPGNWRTVISSPTTARTWARTLATESPGITRKLTTARADCGRTLGLHPALDHGGGGRGAYEKRCPEATRPGVVPPWGRVDRHGAGPGRPPRPTKGQRGEEAGLAVEAGRQGLASREATASARLPTAVCAGGTDECPPAPWATSSTFR